MGINISFHWPDDTVILGLLDENVIDSGSSWMKKRAP